MAEIYTVDELTKLRFRCPTCHSQKHVTLDIIPVGSYHPSYSVCVECGHIGMETIEPNHPDYNKLKDLIEHPKYISFNIDNKNVKVNITSNWFYKERS